MARKVPAVFLDRDNTIIHNDADLGDPDEVRLIQGAASAVASLRGLNYKVVVVTNQGGVARGKYGEDDVKAVHDRISQKLRQISDTYVDRYYFCPFHPEGTVEKYKREHPARKPQPGMLLKAAADLNLDLSQSWMIGDAIRDVQAGKRAGARTILLRDDGKPVPPKHSPPGTIPSKSDPSWSEQPEDGIPDFVAKNLVEAVRIIAQARRPESSEEARLTTARAKKWETFTTPQGIKGEQQKKADGEKREEAAPTPDEASPETKPAPTAVARPIKGPQGGLGRPQESKPTQQAAEIQTPHSQPEAPQTPVVEGEPDLPIADADVDEIEVALDDDPQAQIDAEPAPQQQPTWTSEAEQHPPQPTPAEANPPVEPRAASEPAPAPEPAPPPTPEPASAPRAVPNPSADVAAVREKPAARQTPPRSTGVAAEPSATEASETDPVVESESDVAEAPSSAGGESAPRKAAAESSSHASSTSGGGDGMMLRQILQEMRNQHAARSEFNAIQIIAIVLQIIAAVCLAGGLWMGADDLDMFVRWIGAGILVELSSIALLLMARN